MIKRLGAGCALVFTAALAQPSWSADVTLRHSLEGPIAAQLIELAGRFNQTSKTDKIVLQHVSAVTDQRSLPDMALLRDDQYERFFHTRPRMLSIEQVMKTGGERFNRAQIYPVLADTLNNGKGALEALPLAMSIPVLFYNKDAFRKVGLDPAKPPKTWWTVQDAAGKLLDGGFRCPLTSAEPEWVHVENLASQHGETLSSRERNGATRLNFNSLVEVKHLALLASWQKSLYFHYFGRGEEANDKFASGECAMLTGESGQLKRLAGATPFEVGVAELPYYDDVRGAVPGHVLPDGAALYVLAGKKSGEYKTVARFIAFLMKPEVQKEWVAATGYLPMGPAAVGALASGVAGADVLRVAAGRLAEKRNLTGSRIRLLPGFDRVRAIMGEEMEAVWANRKPAKEALDTAVQRGNALLAPTVAAVPRGKGK